VYEVAFLGLRFAVYYLEPMLSDTDYFFHYRHLLRFVLLHKLDCFSTIFDLPRLRSALLVFSVQRLLDLDDARSFNYFFLARFFFGNGAFVAGFKSSFSLGRSYYSFQLLSFFKERFAHFPLLFLANDLLPFVGRQYFRHFFWMNEFNLSFFDMNLFLEKKNNLALYNLRDFLRYRFFFFP